MTAFIYSLPPLRPTDIAKELHRFADIVEHTAEPDDPPARAVVIVETRSGRQEMYNVLPDRDDLLRLIGTLEVARDECVKRHRMTSGADPLKITDRTPAAPRPRVKLGPLALLSVQWCQQQTFRNWLMGTFPQQFRSAQLTAEQRPAECAAIVVRAICGVVTRRDIDRYKDASDNFRLLIRVPYMQYLERQALYL